MELQYESTRVNGAEVVFQYSQEGDTGHHGHSQELQM